MFKSLPTLGFILLSFAPWAAAQNGASPPVLPTVLDLETAIEMANRYNPQINEARERIIEQSGVLTASESTRLPNLNGFGQYQLEEDTRTGSFGGPIAPDEEYWRYGVGVTQPLYYGGVLNASIRSRRYELKAREYQLVSVQDRVISEVYRKFYDALLARETIVVRKESMTLLENQLRLSKNRFEAGAGAKFDVLQAEVRVSNARPPLIRALNDYVVTIDDLRTSLGAVYAENDSPTNIVLNGTKSVPPMAPPLEAAIAIAITNRPEILEALMQREAAREWLDRTRNQRAPRINLFADYTVENDRFSGNSENLEGWLAGVEATVNIWDGGKIKGETAQAQSVYDQTKLRGESLRLAIELEVRTAWNQAAEAREILDASEQVIAQADEALRLAENRFNAGSITQLDVLSSQLELTQAKLEKITAERNFTIALIELQRATGTLIPPDAEADSL